MHFSFCQKIFLLLSKELSGHLGLMRNGRSGSAEERIFFSSEFGPGPVF